MQSLLQQRLPMSVDSSLLLINKSIFVAGTPAGLLLQLPISSLRRNPKRGLVVTHSEVKGLDMELMFNKNIIELRNDKEYIKKATNAMAMFHTKQRCDCKDNILTHLKMSLN